MIHHERFPLDAGVCTDPLLLIMWFMQPLPRPVGPLRDIRVFPFSFLILSWDTFDNFNGRNFIFIFVVFMHGQLNHLPMYSNVPHVTQSVRK